MTTREEALAAASDAAYAAEQAARAAYRIEIARINKEYPL